MLGSRVRAPEGVQSKRLIINDYRSFCFCASALLSGFFGWEKGRFRGNVIHFVIHKIGWLNLFAQQCKQMNISIYTVFRTMEKEMKIYKPEISSPIAIPLAESSVHAGFASPADGFLKDSSI